MAEKTTGGLAKRKSKEKEGGKEMTGYATRDKGGVLLLHYHYPVRDGNDGIWDSDGSIYLGFSQEIDDKEFADIKWESEPVEIEITRKEAKK